jgi:Lrp/AsnC family transcriptional regulator for asnA, asnC and gidA
MVYRLDEIDKRIIALLQADGRMPNVDIARELGCSEGTVRRRLDRLLFGGAMRIGAILEPARLGLGTHTIIGVDVELAQAERVGRMLAEMPEICSVVYVTGNYDIIAEAVFHSNEELLAFITERIANIPGIRRVETSHILKVLKRTCDWQVFEEGPVAAAPELTATSKAGPLGIAEQQKR